MNSWDRNLYSGIIFHEIGHANEYHNRYKYYNIKPSKINQCNLAIKKERKDYFIHESLALWSEFSAQSFSETYIKQSNRIYIDELIHLINISNSSLASPKTQIDKFNFCYKIGYQLSIITARIIAQNDEITETQLEKELKSTIPNINQSSIQLADALREMNLHLTNWNYNIVAKWITNHYLALIVQFTEDVTLL